MFFFFVCRTVLQRIFNIYSYTRLNIIIKWLQMLNHSLNSDIVSIWLCFWLRHYQKHSNSTDPQEGIAVTPLSYHRLTSWFFLYLCLYLCIWWASWHSDSTWSLLAAFGESVWGLYINHLTRALFVSVNVGVFSINHWGWLCTNMKSGCAQVNNKIQTEGSSMVRCLSNEIANQWKTFLNLKKPLVQLLTLITFWLEQVLSLVKLSLKSVHYFSRYIAYK